MTAADRQQRPDKPSLSDLAHEPPRRPVDPARAAEVKAELVALQEQARRRETNRTEGKP